MSANLDALALAIQLVKELGDDALTVSRTRLVELTANNHRSGARFWRDVLSACEQQLAQVRRLSDVPPPESSQPAVPGALLVEGSSGGPTLSPSLMSDPPH